MRGTALTRLALVGCTEADIASIAGHSLREVLASRATAPILTFTDGAGGFLPGVPLSCSGMGSWSNLRPRPFWGNAGSKDRGCVRLSLMAPRMDPTLATAAAFRPEVPEAPRAGSISPYSSQIRRPALALIREIRAAPTIRGEGRLRLVSRGRQRMAVGDHAPTHR